MLLILGVLIPPSRCSWDDVVCIVELVDRSHLYSHVETYLSMKINKKGEIWEAAYCYPSFSNSE